MGKKIWLLMHPRNFGSEKIVRPPLHVSRGEILHFKYPPVSKVDRTVTRTFRGKKNNNEAKRERSSSFSLDKADSFFGLNFNVYIDVDNRERAREREIKNKRDQF